MQNLNGKLIFYPFFSHFPGLFHFIHLCNIPKFLGVACRGYFSPGLGRTYQFRGSWGLYKSLLVSFSRFLPLPTKENRNSWEKELKMIRETLMKFPERSTWFLEDMSVNYPVSELSAVDGVQKWLHPWRNRQCCSIFLMKCRPPKAWPIEILPGENLNGKLIFHNFLLNISGISASCSKVYNPQNNTSFANNFSAFEGHVPWLPLPTLCLKIFIRT